MLHVRLIQRASDIDVSVTGDVYKNTDLCLTEEVAFSDFQTFRVDGVFYAIEEGIKVSLFWDSADESHLIMPLEGRGTLDLTKFRGLENPRLPGFTGHIMMKVEFKDPARTIEMTKRSLAILLDLSKQRA